jgi:signal transduction histidine kinase
MDTPEQTSSARRPGPVPGDERGWLETILDLHPFPALAVEAATGRTVFANEAARCLGLTPSSEAGPPADFYAADVQGQRIEAGQVTRYLLAHGGDPEGVELTWHTPHQSVSFRVLDRLLQITHGQPPLAVLTFLDITGQKAVEVQLRQALEARDEFFSVATHELKDPLFALQLSIQLLRHAAQKQGEVPAHVRQHLEVSHRQADRLARLIDNLLDVSRITNGRLRLDLEALDLSELAREMVDRVQEKAHSVGTTIDVQNCEPVIGYFDRTKLEQVVGNLLTNAIKYGAGRPVTVRVKGEDGAAVLEVEDRGVGIAPQDQERIFQRFERASENHKQASLGLGLYIVRSLVEAHGGAVGVRSEPGKGATFTVTLPRKRLPPRESAGTERQQPTGG